MAEDPNSADENVEFIPTSESVGIEVSLKDGSRGWIPDVELKPIEGTIFVNLEQAWNFYKEYASNGGFEIKKGGQYKPGKGDPISKYFLCVREGFKPPPKVDCTKIQRNRPSIRVGCSAGIFLHKNEQGLYVVKRFVEYHNHSLVNKSDVMFLKTYREMTFTKQLFLFQISHSNVGPVRGFKLMKHIFGGFEKIGATGVDCKNFRKELNLFIGDRDAQMVIQKLLSRKEFVPGFSMDYQTDETEALTCLFWADEYAKRMYLTFGDIVSFDATFRTNKYKMVFVPFTGIDNHNRCVTFGCGLLAKENIESYKWLLIRFKRAFGRDPKVFVTDQDPAVKQAVEFVYPGSRHRLCMWHIMQKFTAKLGTKLCNDTTFRKRICEIVWTDKITPEVFEEMWISVIKDFGLLDHNWLSDLFDMRYKWIPAYYRDEPMSGLMRTSSRSESENHFFGQMTSTNLTLVEFVSHFDTAMDCQRYVQKKNDHDSRYTSPDLISELEIEAEAAQLYTRTIFFYVQDEIYASLMSCHSYNMVHVGDCKRFMIHDAAEDKEYNQVDENEILYQVDYNAVDMTILCSCKRFESYGLLCRHIFYVLRMLKINEFPKKYLLSRWTKDALPLKYDISRSNSAISAEKINGVESAVREIQFFVESCINRLVADIDKLHLFRDQQKEIMEKVFVASAPKKIDKNKMMGDLLGVSVPPKVGIKPPHGIRNKGCGSGGKKRLISKREVAIKKSGRTFRLCHTCNLVVDDHDSRNCRSLSQASTSTAGPSTQIP